MHETGSNRECRSAQFDGNLQFEAMISCNAVKCGHHPDPRLMRNIPRPAARVLLRLSQTHCARRVRR